MTRDRHNFLVSKFMLPDDPHQFEGECEESTNSSTTKKHDILN